MHLHEADRALSKPFVGSILVMLRKNIQLLRANDQFSAANCVTRARTVRECGEGGYPPSLTWIERGHNATELMVWEYSLPSPL